MALIGKQLQLWHSMSLKLRQILMTRCVDSFPKGELPKPARARIYQLVNQAIDDNSQEGDIFKVAFELFLSQLDLQELSSSQYIQAVSTFTEIPAVDEVFMTLKNYILFHKDVRETLNSTPKSVSSTPVPTSQKDLWSLEPQPFSACSTPLPSISPVGFSFDAERDFSPISQPITPTSIPLLASESWKYSFSIDNLSPYFSKWVGERYSPIDERELTNGEIYIRRMDSLARLLSLRMATSACTAVTLDLSGEPRMVVSANVSENGDQDKILDQLTKKLDIIQRRLADIKATFTRLPTPTELDELANFLARELIQLTETSIPEIDLQQAAKKIIHAACFDSENFNEEQIKAFMNPSALLIVPEKHGVDRDQGFHMRVRQLGAQPAEDKLVDLYMVPKNSAVKDVHAEQLLAHLLFKVQRTSNHLHIGISKLCCLTCFKYLSQHPVTIRGTHNAEYPCVVDLHSGDRPTKVHERRRETRSWASPKDTPDARIAAKRRADAEGIDRDLKFSDTVRARLFPALESEIEYRVVSGLDAKKESLTPHLSPPIIHRKRLKGIEQRLAPDDMEGIVMDEEKALKSKLPSTRYRFLNQSPIKASVACPADDERPGVAQL